MNVLGSFQECFLNVRRSSVKLQAIKMAALLNEDQILQNEKELAGMILCFSLYLSINLHIITNAVYS
jgi:hypothetical protein